MSRIHNGRRSNNMYWNIKIQARVSKTHRAKHTAREVPSLSVQRTSHREHPSNQQDVSHTHTHTHSDCWGWQTFFAGAVFGFSKVFLRSHQLPTVMVQYVILRSAVTSKTSVVSLKVGLLWLLTPSVRTCEPLDLSPTVCQSCSARMTKGSRCVGLQLLH